MPVELGHVNQAHDGRGGEQILRGWCPAMRQQLVDVTSKLSRQSDGGSRLAPLGRALS